MSLSIWTPVDFFVGFSGSRRRLLEVPVVTEERMGRDYKVMEVSWTLVFSVIMIIDLKRHRFGRTNVLAFRSRTTVVSRTVLPVPWARGLLDHGQESSERQRRTV